MIREGGALKLQDIQKKLNISHTDIMELQAFFGLLYMISMIHSKTFNKMR